MRCGGASPEYGDQIHLAKMSREKGVNSSGYRNGC